MTAPEQPGCRTGATAAGRSAVAAVVEDRLCGSGYSALKGIFFDYHAGTLTLRGCLPSYYLKQLAQAAVARVEGVERVVNRIEVRATPAGPR